MDDRYAFATFLLLGYYVVIAQTTPAYYQFGYQVDTLDTGDYHGHMEQLDSQGRKKGEFKVRLPDGRIQVTSYQADEAGFRPRISYEIDPLFNPIQITSGFTPEKKIVKRPPPKNYQDPGLTSYLPPPINYDPRPSPKPVLLTPSDPPFPAYNGPVSKPSYSEPTAHYGPPTRTYSPPDINYQVQKYAPPPIHYEEVYNHVAPSGLYTPPIERYASGEDEETSNLDIFRQALEKQPMDDGQQKYFLVPIKGESGAKPILALLVRKKQ
eukprot:06336.XXX_158823_157620_1 [CDS] Oithona nana genome sequencing.